MLAAAVVLCIADLTLHGTDEIGPLTLAGMALLCVGAISKAALARGAPPLPTIFGLVVCIFFFLAWITVRFFS